MTDPILTPLPAGEVTTALGPYWPTPDGVPVLTLPPDLTEFTGAVAVYPDPGRPGRTWWAVGGLIPPQPAGVPDQALADLLPGSVLTVPATPPDEDPTPPQT